MEQKTRWTLEDRYKDYKIKEGWSLPLPLFYNDDSYSGCIYDFEIGNYISFLDNVKSLQDLIQGLRELSPLTDDALSVAEGMNDNDFIYFKLALIKERQNSKLNNNFEQPNVMENKYLPILIPTNFIPASEIADLCKVPWVLH